MRMVVVLVVGGCWAGGWVTAAPLLWLSNSADAEAEAYRFC